MKRIIAVLSLAFATVLGWATVAGATPPTPVESVGAEMDAAQSSFTDAVVTYGLPLIFGLLVLGLVIRLGVKFVKRGARAV